MSITTQTTEMDTAVEQAAAGSTFAHVDPRTLIIETNVRANADLDEEFIASIRDEGVLTPILVQRHEDGTLHVRAGQRRTLGAIVAERATIPAFIVEGVSSEVDRIVQQVVENDQRKALNDADHAAAFQQMSLLGVPAGAIARRLHKTQAEVEAGITVAASRAGLDAANNGLDLVDAAIFAEFEGDQEATARLKRAVQWNESLQHAAQQIRDQRAERAKVAALQKRLKRAKVTVRSAPAYYDSLVKPLTDLHAKGSKDALTPEGHATCSGHVAWITTSGDEPEVVYGCADYKANGHLRTVQPKPASAPMSEQDRAARREVVANNKAWRSAETVRRAWLGTFAKRKTTPKGAAAFVARVLVDGLKVDQARQQGHQLASRLLGIGHKVDGAWLGTDEAFAVALGKTGAARAQHMALVLAMAAVEESTQTGTWRNAYGVTREYFAFLKDCGYELSQVEALCLPGTAADEQQVNTDKSEQPEVEAADIEE